MIDAHSINQHMLEALTKLDCQPQGDGKKIKALCPLHADTSPSLVSDYKGGKWIWKCWPCDAGGDVIDLIADALNIPRRTGSSIKTVASFLGIDDDGKDYSLTRRPKSRPAESKPKKPLPANYDEIHSIARSRVYDSPSIQQAIASELGVSADTIRNLCFTTDAIGWSNKHQRPLYLYEGGVKIRHAKGSKIRFQWLLGRAENPWRAHYLERPEVTRVFLTEGESDAIALIDAGLECLFPKAGEIGTAIIASPGTSFKESWASLLTGKDLVICADNDPAGYKATQRISELCHSFTNSISRFDWSANPNQ